MATQQGDVIVLRRHLTAVRRLTKYQLNKSLRLDVLIDHLL